MVQKTNLAHVRSHWGRSCPSLALYQGEDKFAHTDGGDLDTRCTKVEAFLDPVFQVTNLHIGF